MPKRIQLKRTKGWKMPPNTVKVDRTTKWGNPFYVRCDQRGIWEVVRPHGLRLQRTTDTVGHSPPRAMRSGQHFA